MKDLTIVCIDTFSHELAKKSIQKTIEHVDAKQIIIFSDKNFYSDANWVRIDKLTRNDYSNFCIKELYNYITTDFVLIVQNDGMAIDSTKWTDEYFNFDYIGASWPQSVFVDFSGVGNGGLSLRSKKLLYELQNNNVVYNPIINKKNIWDTSGEDYVICVEYRNYLESKGINFAPLDIANQFSHEFEPGRKPTFGFHGKFNVPHYLNDNEIEDFIRLLKIRFDKTYMIMLLELIRLEKYDLAKLAIDLGRYNNVWNIFFSKKIDEYNVLKTCLQKINFSHPFVYDIIKKMKPEYADTE